MSHPIQLGALMSIHFPKNPERSQDSKPGDDADTSPIAEESLEVAQLARKVRHFQSFVNGYEEVNPNDVNLCMDAADRLAAELEEKSKKLVERAKES